MLVFSTFLVFLFCFFLFLLFVFKGLQKFESISYRTGAAPHISNLAKLLLRGANWPHAANPVDFPEHKGVACIRTIRTCFITDATHKRAARLRTQLLSLSPLSLFLPFLLPSPAGSFRRSPRECSTDAVPGRISDRPFRNKERVNKQHKKQNKNDI